MELAFHKILTVDIDIQVYFCDPQSPRQRSTNENINGFLRQYSPKKTNLSGFIQKDLDNVAMHLNDKP
jgi:IS30 family transposase